MKLTLLIIFMFVAGTFGYLLPDCYEKEIVKCPGSSSFPREIPETIDELKRECKEYVDSRRCWLNVNEVCNEDADEIAEMRNGFLYLNSTCQEDGHIFKVLSRNLDCFSSEAMSVDEFCHRAEFIILAFTLAKTKREEITGLSESEELLDCLLFYLNFLCKPIILGEKCGEESRQVAFELLKNHYYGLRKCLNKFPEEWAAVSEVYEATILEQYELMKMSNEHRR